MYRKEVRRRRAVLIGLVLVALLLLTATFGQSSNPVSGAVGTVFGPIEDGAGRALKPARDLINWFDETFEARGENEKLREQLVEARRLAVQGQVAIQENDQLRKMAGLRRQGAIPSGYDTVAARVISRSPTLWYVSVTIDQGSGSGIEVDDPVIAGDGLVGRISSVNRGSSVVTLITDGSTGVGAKVVPSGVQGFTEADVADPGKLVLDFLDSERRLGRGQFVVTSGWRGDDLESNYPPNLPIGEIDRAPITEQEAIQRVTVEPFVDMKELDMVEVLTGGSRG